MRLAVTGLTRVLVVGSTLVGITLLGCDKEREMPDDLTMPDSMPVIHAMQEEGTRSALLDTMPGGEMARGDSVAEMKLLKKKASPSEGE